MPGDSSGRSGILPRFPARSIPTPTPLPVLLLPVPSVPGSAVPVPDYFSQTRARARASPSPLPNSSQTRARANLSLFRSFLVFADRFFPVIPRNLTHQNNPDFARRARRSYNRVYRLTDSYPYIFSLAEALA